MFYPFGILIGFIGAVYCAVIGRYDAMIWALASAGWALCGLMTFTSSS